MTKSLKERIEEIEFEKNLLSNDIEYKSIIWYDIHKILKELNQFTKEYSESKKNELLLHTTYNSISELFVVMGMESRDLCKCNLNNIQIDDLIGHAFLDGLQDMLNQLLIPKIDHLIDQINKKLDVRLDREEVFNTYNEYWNVAYLLEDYYSNVTYKTIDPLYLFEQFVAEYSIYLNWLPNHTWQIVFTDTYEVKRKEYSVTNFYGALNVIYEQTINEVCTLLKNKEWYHKEFYVKPYPYENIDFQLIQTMTPQELFEYLKSHKGVVLNMEDFKFLYLLLNYQDMNFDEERIRRWIQYNLDHNDDAKNFDANKSIFCGYPIRICDVESLE